MHSSIRWFIHNKGDWDYETWGAPINQEDMLGTIMVIGAHARRYAKDGYQNEEKAYGRLVVFVEGYRRGYGSGT